MQRTLLLLLLSAFTLLAEEPWPSVKFTEVRAFAWPDDKETEEVVLSGMKLKYGAINPEGAVLTPEQVKQLVKAVTGKYPRHPVAMCYLPHNAFVFYDAEKKPVAFVEICFGCLGHRISPKGAAPSLDLLAIAALFDAHKLPMGEYPNLAVFKKAFEALQRSTK